VGLGPAWLAMVLLLWAPVMSLARVIMGVHYLSDVVAGFVFGLVVGWVFITLSPQIISSFPILFSPTFWNFLF
jgi:undecaprenyl-diphosphatase